MTQPQQAPPPENQGVSGETVAVVSVAAFETLVFTAAMAAYTSWLALVSKAVLSMWHQYGAAPDPTAIYSTIPDWDRQIAGIVDEVAKVSKYAWEQTMRDLNLDIPWNRNDPLVQEQLLRTRNLLVDTPDEVYRMVVHAIGAGADAGENNDQIAHRINNILNINGSPNWPGRARNIATTETTRALAFGRLAAGQRAQERTGARMAKRWKDERDGRVRLTHRNVNNGKAIGLRDYFMVGGFPMQGPGDPLAPADEVCGCRCDLEIVRMSL